MANLPFHVRPSAEASAAPGQFGDFRGLARVGAEGDRLARTVGGMARRSLDEKAREDADNKRKDKALEKKEKDDKERIRQLQIKMAENALREDFNAHVAGIDTLLSEGNFSEASSKNIEWKETWEQSVQKRLSKFFDEDNELDMTEMGLIMQTLQTPAAELKRDVDSTVSSAKISSVTTTYLSSSQRALTPLLIRAEGAGEAVSHISAKVAEDQDTLAGIMTNPRIDAAARKTLNRQYSQSYSLLLTRIHSLRGNEDAFEQAKSVIQKSIIQNPFLDNETRLNLSKQLASMRPAKGDDEEESETEIITPKSLGTPPNGS